MHHDMPPGLIQSYGAAQVCLPGQPCLYMLWKAARPMVQQTADQVLCNFKLMGLYMQSASRRGLVHVVVQAWQKSAAVAAGRQQLVWWWVASSPPQ
jgi:hypothetical protein